MYISPARLSGSVRRISRQQSGGKSLAWGLLGLALGLGGGGCGPAGGPGMESEVLGVVWGEEQTHNGLSTNGLSTNGLSTNGLSTNGLSTNGLSTHGFSTWFNQDIASARAVMEYVVKCAVPAGQTRTYTHPRTKVTYTWAGSLGLAPDWSSGLAASELEQQVVSACLAAHANKYGIHIPISVLGRNAQGTAIPYTASELSTYTQKEACFFGNLFDGSGLYAAHDQDYLNAHESTSRACGLTSSATTAACPPIVQVGSCHSLCERVYDSSGAKMYYSLCTYNGKAYRPITTRIRSQDVYRCGDGVCQFTESCGTGNTYHNCQADCGTCS